jgi:hypothetical protein
MADAGGLQGRMMAQGRQIDAVGTRYIQKILVGFHFKGLIVDFNGDQSKRLRWMRCHGAPSRPG